jgi:rhamnulokinase/L-fuculokinase
LLTGEKFTEVSIASTSGLMNPVNKKWHVDVMNQLGLPIHIFPEIVNEGTHVGQLLPELGLKSIPVVHVCSHDTASAFVNATDDAYFISCGTWSLIGVEKNEPALTETVRKFNMTNESGIDETTRLLKNITGLWIIQELKRDFTRLGKNYDYSDFERLARDATPWQYIINTEDSRFLEPNDMIKKIHDYLFETNQGVPVDDGALIRLIYESLALKYKETLEQLADVNGKPLNKIKMVGGGIQSKILCEMVASATNLPVEAGPIEATALGNIGVMLMTVGCFDEVSTMRKWLKGFSDVVFYEPTDVSGWQAQYEKFEVLMKTVIS